MINVTSFPHVIITYCQKVLPAVFDDSLSYYEMCCKLVVEINKIIDNTNNNSGAIAELQTFTQGLRKELDEFKAHGFDEFYKAQVQAWIDSHLNEIFGRVVRQVYFGLTLDGHFVAYIPSGWTDIVFDTGMVYGLDTYGRLILRWDVDGSARTVNQIPERLERG